MKVETSQMTGPALRWAVAKCEGVLLNGEVLFLFDGTGGGYNYDTDWSQAGPIIERKKIRVSPNMGGSWSAQIRHTTSHPLVSHPILAGWTNKAGPTPLVAAMRCYVASKLGDEVEIPDELLRSF